jgi:four helix bundle protein
MNSNQLKIRTKKFAKEIIHLVNDLPNNRVGWTITDQIVRSSTSVAANYRAVCRAKSSKDFVYKIAIVIEEADETQFWLEMIDELKLTNNKSEIERILKEANELVAIFVSSSKTAKKRLK